MARTNARATSSADNRAFVLAAALCVLAAIAVASAAIAADSRTKTTLAIDPVRFFDTIVKVQARAVPDARSSATLGQDREGTGIVISEDGLVLTIGYLVVEAADVKILDNRGHSLPARVVAADNATGFALVRPVTPVHMTALPLGDSSKLADHAPVMIVNHDGVDDITFALVVAKRPFTGNWEYMLDQAIFTSPPALNWSGAALVGPDGRLLGVGSLIVRNVTKDEAGLPGNMFVPIDVLKPILQDLIKDGKRSEPERPWLGIAADEVQGRLLVSRVSPDSPADKAGVKPGDIILGVGTDSVRTQADFYRKVWSRGNAGCDIPLKLLQDIDVKEVSVHSIDRGDYFRARTTF